MVDSNNGRMNFENLDENGQTFEEENEQFAGENVLVCKDIILTQKVNFKIW